jgi:murein L,D-transpeptidase YcbB/YkuD
MLALNLERRRWVSGLPQESRLEVNVSAFTLELRDSGRVVERMRVVVGEPSNPSPVFSDIVTYLQFNPPWRVPKRIVSEEILPAWKRDTTYLTRNRMRVLYMRVKRPFMVEAAAVDWAALERDTFASMVVQDGGEGNPLGRIKFMCPNEYDVYLHDTPSRSHFADLERARSHGCIRVERPYDLAARLLGPQMEASRDSVDSLVARGLERVVGLDRRLPVHVLYWTAWVDSAGATQFRDDLYGIDQRLDEALRRRRPGAFVLNPKLLWGEEKARADSLARVAAGDGDPARGPWWMPWRRHAPPRPPRVTEAAREATRRPPR